jgi:PKD repeat protein
MADTISYHTEIKMIKKIDFRSANLILGLLFIAFLFVSIPSGFAYDYDNSSNYLAEYGVKLYNEGNIPDALHEFNKCLIVNPTNKVCQEYVDKILARKKPVVKKEKCLPPPIPLPPEPKPCVTPKPYFTAPQNICVNQEIVLLGAVSDDVRKFCYSWDFGDGTRAEGEKVFKTYSRPGIYKIILVVDDNLKTSGSRGFVEKTIVVDVPPRAVAGPDIDSCVGTAVVFDGSATLDKGNAFCYSWDFGDGTRGEGIKTTHVYDKPGEYIAKLTVAKKDASSACREGVATKKVRIFSSLCDDDVIKRTRICFDADGNLNVRLSFKEGLLVTRSATYLWDFGDGTTAEGLEVTHQYAKSGAYDVKLTVNDGRNLPCSTCTKALALRLNRKPVAKAGPNIVCCVQKEALFDASSSYDPDNDRLSYIWDFGDGTKGEGVQASHRYLRPGDYTVTLTVKDNSDIPCNNSTTSFTASVMDKPTSIIEVKEKNLQEDL